MLLIAIAIELLGIAVTGAGIGMEIALGGDIHLVMITGGSCLVAFGGVIFGKFYKIRPDREKRK